MPYSEPLTVDDIADPPDDGHRYEIVDGSLIVTPSPSLPHQTALLNLIRLVDQALPDQLRIIVAPFDWVVSDDTKLQPDLMVVVRDDAGYEALHVAPKLVVEILSPSTRRIDLGTKKLAFAEAGVQHYWVVDPLTPSLTAFGLVGDEFVVAASAVGSDEITTEAPVRVTVCPARLLD